MSAQEPVISESETAPEASTEADRESEAVQSEAPTQVSGRKEISFVNGEEKAEKDGLDTNPAGENKANGAHGEGKAEKK